MRRVRILISVFAVVAGLVAAGSFARAVRAQDATPVAGRDVPAPEECAVAPRSADDLAALATPLAATPAAAQASPTPPAVPFGAPDGEVADPETAAAVVAVIRESWACLNAGDFPRFLALLTDEEVRQNFPPEALLEAHAPADGTPPAAPAAERTALFAILDLERLPDGRVGAFVVVDTAGDPLPVEINYQIAAETAAGWRLDDFICFSEVGQLC